MTREDFEVGNDLSSCDSGEVQTMSHIVEACPAAKPESDGATENAGVENVAPDDRGGKRESISDSDH